MDFLKKFFPLSFKPMKDVGSLIIRILIYLAIGIIYSIVVGICAIIPVLGWILAAILGIIAPIVGLYNLAGIVLAILVYTKVIKDEPAEAPKAEEAVAEETVETTEDAE